MAQKITSAETSVNIVSRPYKHFPFAENSVILDYGCGKYDTAAKYANQQGHLWFGYDPYNLNETHNLRAIHNFSRISKGCDRVYIICANVLNVIEDIQDIFGILHRIHTLSDEKTTVLFSMYEGNGTGVGKATAKGYQRNEKIKEYLPHIQQYFRNIEVKNGIVSCNPIF